jgi:hypothetical protein
VRIEPLAAAVPLRRADEGGRAFDAEEAQLALEGVGHVLRAVVVPDGEAARDARGEAAEVTAHALAHRLESHEAGGAPGGVDTDALGGAVVDGDEDGGLAFAGDRGGQVGPPTSHPPRRGRWCRRAARGPRGAPLRAGASRPRSRVSRGTRRREVRTPR